MSKGIEPKQQLETCTVRPEQILPSSVCGHDTRPLFPAASSSSIYAVLWTVIDVGQSVRQWGALSALVEIHSFHPISFIAPRCSVRLWRVFIGPRCPWSDLWIRLSLTEWVSTTPCWNLTDVTLADEDTNWILNDNANRAIQGNVAMRVTLHGGQLWNQCKWCHLVAKIGTNKGPGGQI